jgi:lipopolysaccharide/colanic/teichoic acid biosynthesis glycosyltransferase/VanZ family protein
MKKKFAGMMKPKNELLSRFFKYWLPPLAWMAFIFPLANRSLGSPWIYNVTVSAIRWIFPNASPETIATLYIIERKSFHFIEYGFLAFLLFRAFRGPSRRTWNSRWALASVLISSAYGFIDEAFQAVVPSRNASLLDGIVDTAGSFFVVGIIAILAGRNSMAAARIGRKALKAAFLKRPFDISLSLLGIVLSSPLWILFSLLIWLGDRGPVFYAQARVGKQGRIFRALKFRSMIKDAEKSHGPVQAVANDPRVTRIGRLLRATAMDELPQLLNIFLGDMSFVGPRALRPEEREMYGNPGSLKIDDIPGYRERQTVRPGLTGLAQIFLPSDAPRRKKFRYDALYIKKQSFWFDLKIMILSFWITFRGKWESRQHKI